MEDLLAKVSNDYPRLKFIEGAHFSWHAHKKHVSYKTSQEDTGHHVWALLHELGHALLDHADYANDVELLQLEVAAWEKAVELGRQYGFTIEEDYMEDCLDTYRDWLHLRSTCPNCYSRTPQENQTTYRCFNCQTRWHVTRSRLCRPYRSKQTKTPAL